MAAPLESPAGPAYARTVASPLCASLPTLPSNVVQTKTESAPEEKLPVEVEKQMSQPPPEPYSEIPHFPMPEGLDGIPISEILEAIPPTASEGQ